MICPQCNFENPEGFRFCGECGGRIDTGTPWHDAKGERKYATVMFSDLSGYTAMTEKLDPEEVKHIVGRIFEGAGRIVEKYEGTVERFFGDEIMALFGVPVAHEDDAVRAIRAAREIHDLVTGMSPSCEAKYQIPLNMHTGINTGLMITGEKKIGKGRHGLTGDTINLAKRLTGLAGPDEIVIGSTTQQAAVNHFVFESRTPATVKGKQVPLQTFRVISTIEEPKTIRRLHGVRADLVGRDKELERLNEAVKDLLAGKGSIIGIYGDAGTGKSRLIEDFKTSMDDRPIRWLEGHAYPYAQNISFFPLIDLCSREFKINESDPPEVVRKKLATGISRLVDDTRTVLPFISPLYAVDATDAKALNPQFWKLKLQDATRDILTTLAHIGPTIICLEDLHWADPSFMEMLRGILSGFTCPVLFICVYRPDIRLFVESAPSLQGLTYDEIHIKELSPPDTRKMILSALDAEEIPHELHHLLVDKTAGNPFFLEEMVNSLIEANVLVTNQGRWRLISRDSATDFSVSIHGVIASRLDRLDPQSKQVIKEAAVIGRTFYRMIIQRISTIKNDFRACLANLERLDLIKARPRELDLEYIFKHALTQEVVYKGVLKDERRTIHERIGQVMEVLFEQRLAEFYETLAYHFSRGKSPLKAVDYLIKSGEKSLQRYAVEEAHQHFQQALDIIDSLPDPSSQTMTIMVDMLNRWSIIYYYRGDPGGLKELLFRYETVAEAVDDSDISGMFRVWQGFALYYCAELDTAYEYLVMARDIGETANSRMVVGYACNWLSFLCAEMGRFSEGIAAGERAHRIARELGSDQFLHFKSLTGIAWNHYFMGNAGACSEIGKELIEYGRRHSHIRCLVMGYGAAGQGYLHAGDFPGAIEAFEQAVETSADPFYRMFSEIYLALAYLGALRLEDAADMCRRGLDFSTAGCCRQTEIIWGVLLGIVRIDAGELNRGMAMVQENMQTLHEIGRRGPMPMGWLALAQVYLEIVKGSKPVSPLMLVKNLSFVCRHALFAERKAHECLEKALDLSMELGAHGIAGQVHLELGKLYLMRKRKNQAHVHLELAAKMFSKVGASDFLKGATEALCEAESV